jgi:hypothetical protein
VDRVSYVTSPPPPLQQALNTFGVAWGSTGDVYTNGWFAQTNVTHDGQWAAQSGAVWHDQTNWLRATVSGVTNVSFWWKVSSDIGDFMQFRINGQWVAGISGEVDWQSNYFALSPNINVLEWCYGKDDWITEGGNCGWVDQVAFGGSFPALPYTLQAPVRLPDGRIQLTVTGEVGSSCRVQFSTNLLNPKGWTQFTNFTSISANTAVVDPGATNSPNRYYRAVSP